MNPIQHQFHAKHTSNSIRNTSESFCLYFLLMFVIVSAHKFVKINLSSPYNVFYKFNQLTHHCETSTILILHET
jgi:hypothetical protein